MGKTGNHYLTKCAKLFFRNCVTKKIFSRTFLFHLCVRRDLLTVFSIIVTNTMTMRYADGRLVHFRFSHTTDTYTYFYVLFPVTPNDCFLKCLHE